MGGGALLGLPKHYVLCLSSQCASRCYFHRFCLCMSEIIFSFRSLRVGSQLFVLLMLFFCVILHTMWSDTVVISAEYVCCSVVFDTLVGVSVHSDMWPELLMTYVISCPLWSSVYECQSV